MTKAERELLGLLAAVMAGWTLGTGDPKMVEVGDKILNGLEKLGPR